MPFEAFMEALCRLALLKALPTDDEIRATGAPHAGIYLSQLRERDPAGYKALIKERSRLWGDDPDLVQPVHRCVAHMLSLLVHQLKWVADKHDADTSSPTTRFSERTMAKVVIKLGGDRSGKK